MSGGLATRLYRGELNLNIVGKRNMWFGIAGGIMLVALVALIAIGFTWGIEFKGGNEFQVPAATVGSLAEVDQVISDAVHAQPGLEDAQVQTGQQIGDGDQAVYSVQTSTLTADQATQVKEVVAAKYGLQPNQISDSQVSARWGEQVTNQALISLMIFLAAVSAYLWVRFEWQMAVAAVASLLFNLLATAGVYSIVGFEVSPSTVIGFLTILGFALYDVVVVFDKVQENTRGITGQANQTYAEATNLALNQTFMRSINTSLVALLPVGGLLFIGAGLLGAGTLKDLGLVLFIGMGMAVYSSLFFASPVLVWLKEKDPVIANHTKRVLARRAGLAAKAAAGDSVDATPAMAASAAPKTGAKPTVGKRPTRPASGGSKRR